MNTRIDAYVTAAAVCGILFFGAPVFAQDYPTKPVRIVVGFAAGGPTDVIARIIAQDMTAMWGQPVIVDNRTGANSLIATETVAAAPPDGYTLLFASLSHNVNAILLPNVKYGPLKSFAPITLAAVLPLLVITKPDAPFNSVQELIKLAKAKPGEITYGSAGNGGSAHLAAALLETSSGAKMTHVPFRGNAPALTEVVAGRVTFMFYPMIGIQDYVQTKRLKVLAAGTAKRHPGYVSVPTMAESGFPGFEDTAPWVGLLAPAKTPPAIVNRLNDAVRKSIAKPDSKKRLEALGATTVGDSPAEFTSFLQNDWDRWARVIKAAGVKAE
ncbi:MAG: Bug family tripartite tricarboxylate transporter substrate binding protein [Burkholderiales bacterium]